MIPSLEGFTSQRELTLDCSEQSIDEAIRDAGLDPAEWVVSKAGITKSAGRTLLRIQLTPLPVRQARMARPPWTQHPTPRERPDRPVRTWVFCSDQHAPNHDQPLHEAACEFIHRNKPDLVIAGGDGCNFPNLSRFQANMKYDTDAQASIDGYHRILADYKQAAPKGAELVALEGNHDRRIYSYGVSRAYNIAAIRAAGDPIPAHSLQRLLRLDELGYHWIEDYPRGRFEIAPGYWAIHGYKVRKNAGETAWANIADLGVSVVCGHIHTGAKVHHTKPAIGLSLEGIESPCMCGDQGYEIFPDWDHGFTVGWVDDDGRCHGEVVRWIDGKLRYPRGWR